MVLYSFGFAAFVFSALPIETAGPTIRRAFPYFYLFVIATSAVAALLLWPSDRSLSLGVAAIALTGLPARQILMPAINRATDTGATARFKRLHALSVSVTLSHIVLSGWVLSQIPGLANLN